MKENEHSLSLINRSELRLNGVVKIESSDEDLIALRTNLGISIINGSGLFIKALNLDEGLVTIGGDFDGIRYENKEYRGVKKKSSGFFGRLMK